MKKTLYAILSGGVLILLLGVDIALAESVEMRSTPWQLFFQNPMSPSAEKIYEFNVFLLWVEGLITVFVLGLMAYICIKFRAKKNPTPSKTTHNTFLEVLWTGIPVFILIAIAIPSIKILYFTDTTQNAEMTLKITGNQWYWTYEYPDHDGLTFDSNMLTDDELKPGQPRLLSVDNPVVLPANTKIRLLMGSNDVMHNWAMPSLAIKVDTVPGRINETWTEINEAGDYFGQCSELCGVNHGFMPIHIRALPREQFANWIAKAKKEFASNVKATPKKLVHLANSKFTN